MKLNEIVENKKQYRFHASGAVIPHMGAEMLRRIVSEYEGKQKSGVVDGMTFLLNLSQLELTKFQASIYDFLGYSKSNMWTLEQI